MTVDASIISACAVLTGAVLSGAAAIITAIGRAKAQILQAGAARQVINSEHLASIEDKVNGSASVATAKIDSLHTEVASAKAMIADLHQQAAVLEAKREG